METITISRTYSLKWFIKDHENYKVSPCGRIFNCKRGKEIKRIMVGSSIGFCISGKFITLKQLRTKLILIPIETKLPF